MERSHLEKVVLWLLNYCSRCHVSRPLPNEKGNFIGHFYRQSQTMEGNSEARTTDAADNGSNTDSSTSTLAYDKLFICSANGLFTLIEIVSAAADLQLSVGNDDGNWVELQNMHLVNQIFRYLQYRFLLLQAVKISWLLDTINYFTSVVLTNGQLTFLSR